MSWYRVQSADRDVLELLDPEYQWSHTWGYGRSARGVSVCESVEDLLLYLATPYAAAIPVREGWVLVELEGERVPNSRPVDPEFETLIFPTKVIGVTEVDDHFMATISDNRRWLASLEPDME